MDYQCLRTDMFRKSVVEISAHLLKTNHLPPQVKIWFQNRRMKWKRSRKAKEQGAEARLLGSKRAGKSSDNRRSSAQDDDDDDDLEGKEEEEDEEADEAEEDEMELRASVGAVGGGGARAVAPRQVDFSQHSSELSYSSHGSYSEDELEEMGTDRKTRVGL